MSEDLREALLGFDGKAISYLSETRVRYEDDANFIPELVTLSADLTIFKIINCIYILNKFN